MRKYLIILGILELIFPSLALYILIPLLELQKKAGIGTSTNSFLGFVFFGLALIFALVQVISGMFSLDLKLGNQKTKYLIIIGGVFALLTIPAFIFFVISALYSTASALR